MLQKLQSYKVLVITLLIVLSSVLSLLLPIDPVKATSIYDGSYQSTTSLHTSSTSPQCDSVDTTHDWSSYLLDEAKWPSSPDYSAARTSFQSALNNESDGAWGATQFDATTLDTTQFYWTEDPTAHLEWSSDGVDVTTSTSGNNIYVADVACSQKFYGIGGSTPVVISVTPLHSVKTSTSSSWSSFYIQRTLFIHGFDISYPTGYEGEDVLSLDADLDGDGLIEAREMAQSTSDSNQDSDEDGLNDFIESPWYADRDTVFCGTECAYPNPSQKDLYAEIDWMDDGATEYKPSNTQLELVEDMFANKGINFHADTGQFGGGNELPTYTQPLRRTVTLGQTDFWDYKNGGDGITANFSSDRSSIWRYMIYGYSYLESTVSSGWSETMGDDLFISGGLIEDMTGLANTSRAIANTIAHEIGHNICLSDEKVYEEQPDECVFDGIDNDDANDSEYNLENYESVMNYRYQLTDVDDINVVNYSDGTHGSGDHNDWDGVMTGMSSFSGTRTQLGAELTVAHTTSPDGSVIIDEAPIPEIMENNKRQATEEAKSQSDNEPFAAPVEDTPAQQNQEQGNKDVDDGGNPQSQENSLLRWGSVIVLLTLLTAGIVWLIKKKK
jgi:hypothetical protein